MERRGFVLGEREFVLGFFCPREVYVGGGLSYGASS